MQRLGLEWLYRLVSEPRRLFRRYVLSDLPFAVRLLIMSALASPGPSRRSTISRSEVSP
jgi:N-acetylglucosaminyldiphosphoundecaprenol N-acetyl-beta-D-mannosaminyltransferase